MRLPRTTAIRPDSQPAHPDKAHRRVSGGQLERRGYQRSGIQPQGCCGAKVCAPFIGCKCLGIELPFC
jgi:hypothetical protein